MTYRTVGRVSWRFEVKPADCWIGVFTKSSDLGCVGGYRSGCRPAYRKWNAWVCVLPMLPLHLVWWVDGKEAS